MATTTTRPTAPDDNDDIRRDLKIAGIYDRNKMDWLNKFHRFGLIDPYNRLYNTREYLFFTKPDLHIFQNGNSGILNPELANSSFFVDLLARGYGPILSQLQYSSSKYPFMNILSNTKVSNLDLPGISADDLETSANLYGTRLYYRKNSNISDENYDFSLEFEDTKHLEVYYLLKAYDEYQRKKYFGSITPPAGYTLNKKLHDKISIFKFIVGDDGTTIIYFAKLHGCYTKNVPRDVFSELPIDGQIRYNIQWKADFVEDLEPVILAEFNDLARVISGNTMPIYDNVNKHINYKWATIPYIQPYTSQVTKYTTYKLKWKG